MTYYGTGIEVASAFDMKSALPVDGRAVASDLTERDAIASGIRYEGMIVYVESEEKNYQLVGGISNSDWFELSSGAGGGGNVPRLAENLGVKAEVVSGDLVISVKQADGETDPDSTSPVRIAFRDPDVAIGGYVIRTLDVAESLTVPSGATLGIVEGRNSSIWVYLLDDGGDVKLGVSTANYGEIRVYTSTTSISTSSDDNDLYTQASIAGPVGARVVGKITVNEVTAGVWTVSPISLSILPMGIDVQPSMYLEKVLAADFAAFSPTADVWQNPDTSFTLQLGPGAWDVTVQAMSMVYASSGIIGNQIGFEVAFANDPDGGEGILGAPFTTHSGCYAGGNFSYPPVNYTKRIYVSVPTNIWVHIRWRVFSGSFPVETIGFRSESVSGNGMDPILSARRVSE